METSAQAGRGLPSWNSSRMGDGRTATTKGFDNLEGAMARRRMVASTGRDCRDSMVNRFSDGGCGLGDSLPGFLAAIYSAGFYELGSDSTTAS